MNKTRKQLVEEYCEKIDTGKIDFSDVRKELERNGHSQDEISVILRRVDRDLDRRAVARAESANGKQIFFVGLGIMILGIYITVATYTGIIDTGDSFIIAYGPALGGLSLAVIGALKMRN